MTDFVKENEEIDIPILEIRKEVESEQNARIRKIKNNRDDKIVKEKLNQIESACMTGDNVVSYIISAVESYATLEEIVNSMKSVYGEWNEKVFF